MSTRFLDRLGFYGLDKLEGPIMAGLASGEAVLLIGDRGTGKTSLLKALSKLILPPEEWETGFRAFSMPTLQLEDLVGFFNPKKLNEGEVSYIPTRSSAWGAKVVLFDETNRTNYGNQSKIMQYLLSGELMGVKTGLVYRFGAMNPLHYSGTTPLEGAYADRWAIVLDVPAFHELSEENRKRVVSHPGNDTQFALDYYRPGEGKKTQRA